jgi:hypothetical protein
MWIRDEVAAANARRDFLLNNVRPVEGPLPTPCLDLQRALSWKGYGHVGYRSFTYGTHRLFYTLRHGPIPQGLYCCHICNRPQCCEVSHLFLGTAQDNYDDMISKGRGRRYVRDHHGATKLTSDDVANILGLRLQGYTPTSLARRYGVTRGTIHHYARSGIVPAPNPVLRPMAEPVRRPPL